MILNLGSTLEQPEKLQAMIPGSPLPRNSELCGLGYRGVGIGKTFPSYSNGQSELRTTAPELPTLKTVRTLTQLHQLLLANRSIPE